MCPGGIASTARWHRSFIRRARLENPRGRAVFDPDLGLVAGLHRVRRRIDRVEQRLLLGKIGPLRTAVRAAVGKAARRPRRLRRACPMLTTLEVVTDIIVT